jgi:integrase
MGISIKFEFHLHISRVEKGMQSSKQQTDSTMNEKGFLATAKGIAEKLRPTLSPSTIKNYLTALHSLKDYLGGEIAIKQLDNQTFKGFEKWLLQRKVCLNTISCYMRSLRSLFRKVKGEADSEAFSSVYTGKAKTEKRAIEASDIIRLKSISLKPGSSLCQARDMFLFSFYALGMPFVDMAFLRKSQINGERLVYLRHKTGQRISVRLEPCMTEIIRRYQTDHSEYVFPIIDSNDPYKEYHQKLVGYNRALKSLGKKAGISANLTSYTPRHTWASLAYSSNVDLPVISKALGHTNPQTTMTYIRQINDARLEDANHGILERLSHHI